MYGTDLEARLSRDTDGSELRALHARLGRTRERLKRELELPQDPASFRRLTALSEACSAGQAVLKKLWRRLRRIETGTVK
jgi:type III secretion system YseE family protein